MDKIKSLFFNDCIFMCPDYLSIRYNIIMKYISGIFALYIPCSPGTTGDWHSSSLPWDKLSLHESEDSVLKEKGIEKDVIVKELGGRYTVANHIRTISNLLDHGDYVTAEGMRNDYLDDDRRFDSTLFEYVYALKETKSDRDWWRISLCVEQEYMLKWLKFLEEKGISKPKKAITVTDDIKRRCEENSGDIESFFIDAGTKLSTYGGLDYLYDVCWMINHCRDRLPDSLNNNLDSIIRYNRGSEYFEYVIATYEVSGIEVDEIEREFKSAVRDVMP